MHHRRRDAGSGTCARSIHEWTRALDPDGGAILSV